MDDLFKQNLLRLRQPPKPSTFAEALFSSPVWAKKPALSSTSKPTVSKQEFSEKAQVIESLERFAQEKIQETAQPVIKFPGGEIAIKAEPTWDGIAESHSFGELAAGLSLEPATLELTLAQKKPGEVRVLFVPEAFRSHAEYHSELKEGFINQLLPAFPYKTAELFSRMLGAMKLEDKEVIIYPSSYLDHDTSSEVMKVVAYYRPEVIITLGASPTHKILKSQERLAQVHGQFFNRKIENIGTFIVVPLFHPSIIENNQNMKKTAWADMQKIMKQLKKL